MRKWMRARASLLTKCQIFHKIPPQVGFERKKQQTHNESVDFSAHRFPLVFNSTRICLSIVWASRPDSLEGERKNSRRFIVIGSVEFLTRSLPCARSMKWISFCVVDAIPRWNRIFFFSLWRQIAIELELVKMKSTSTFWVHSNNWTFSAFLAINANAKYVFQFRVLIRSLWNSINSIFFPRIPSLPRTYFARTKNEI